MRKSKVFSGSSIKEINDFLNENSCYYIFEAIPYETMLIITIEKNNKENNN